MVEKVLLLREKLRVYVLGCRLSEKFHYEYVIRSMKRDHKSANVNFEIVKYVIDDRLTKTFF